MITLDADLQNPPEEIGRLVAAMDAGADYVGTVRIRRQDVLWRKAASRLMNRVRERTTSIRITDQGCMLRAYHRSVIDALNRCTEVSTYVPALAYTFARHPVEIEVAHAERTVGKSKYSLFRLIRLNFDLMTGFSVVPLQFFSMSGIVIALLSLAFVIFLAIRRLVVGPEAEGLFTLFGIAFFLIGVALIGLGVVGEYVGRIYEQVRQRPRYTVAAVLGADEDGRPGAAAAACRAQRAAAARSDAAAAATGAGSGGVSPGRAVVFAYHDVGVRCLKALISAGLDIPLVVTVPDDPQETPWFASVAATAADYGLRRAGAARRARAAAAGPAGAAAPGFRVLLLLPRAARRAAAAVRAARRAQHARLAAAEVPRPRTGQLGDPARRARDRRDAALHGGARRRRRHRRRAGRADPFGRRCPRGVRQGHRRGRDACWRARCRRCSPAPRRAGRSRSCAGEYFGRRTPADGRIDWAAGALAVHNLVRAVAPPFPGAFGQVGGERWQIQRTRLSGQRVAAGAPRLFAAEGACHIACGDGGVLRLLAAADAHGPIDLAARAARLAQPLPLS